MIVRTVVVLLLLLACVQPALAGYYTSMDHEEDTRWNRDFINVFEPIVVNLANIADPKANSRIRSRYVLAEALGKDGNVKLTTVADKLNYSAVLIRRGKAYEATHILQPLSREEPKHFLVWAHLATASFLSHDANFKENSLIYMDDALNLWPKEKMEQLDPAMQQFLKSSQLKDDYNLEKYRKIEEYFKRLMRHRIKEERLAKQKKPLPDSVDPIFLDEDSKEDPKPAVKFLNEQGEFEVGRIAKAEKAKLPRDAVEIVEQLLIWMPADQRLLWLLGETFNACAADESHGDDRNRMLRSASRIFFKMDDPLNRPQYGAQAIKERRQQ